MPEIIVRTARDTIDATLAPQNLAVAFHQEAVSRYVFPDPYTRSTRLQAMFTAYGGLVLNAGHLDMADQRGGTALWLPADFQPSHGFDELLMEAVGDSSERLSRVLDIVDESHPDPIAQPHMYLLFMGAAMQRKGAGSALLKHGLERVDSLGIGAYLAASNNASARLFTRFGFEALVAKPLRLDQNASITPMWRPPGPAASPES